MPEKSQEVPEGSGEWEHQEEDVDWPENLDRKKGRKPPEFPWFPSEVPLAEAWEAAKSEVNLIYRYAPTEKTPAYRKKLQDARDRVKVLEAKLEELHNLYLRGRVKCDWKRDWKRHRVNVMEYHRFNWFDDHPEREYEAWMNARYPDAWPGWHGFCYFSGKVPSPAEIQRLIAYAQTHPIKCVEPACLDRFPDAPAMWAHTETEHPYAVPASGWGELP